MKKIILLSLLLLTNSLFAADSYTAHYNLYWGGMKIGKVERKLTKNGNIYSLSSLAKPQGLAKLFTQGIIEKSKFKKDGNRLKSLEYYYEQKGKKERRVKHKYSWSDKSLQILQPKHLKLKKIKPDTIDLLSFQHQVSLDLAQGKTSFSGRVYKKTKQPDVYTLKVSGREKVSVPAGNFDTSKIIRTNAGNKKYSFWCAKELNFLPVKIEHTTKKGELARMLLTSISFN